LLIRIIATEQQSDNLSNLLLNAFVPNYDGHIIIIGLKKIILKKKKLGRSFPRKSGPGVFIRAILSIIYVQQA
jgi:hypothetical protein